MSCEAANLLLTLVYCANYGDGQVCEEHEKDFYVSDTAACVAMVEEQEEFFSRLDFAELRTDVSACDNMIEPWTEYRVYRSNQGHERDWLMLQATARAREIVEDQND